MGANTTGSMHANEQKVSVQTLGEDLEPKRRLLDESVEINHKKTRLHWSEVTVDGDSTVEWIEVPSLTTSISPEPINSINSPGSDDIHGLELHSKDVKGVKELVMLNSGLNNEKNQCETSGDEIKRGIQQATLASPPVSPLTTFPDEIFQIIFAHLTIADIIHLSATNKAIRSWLTPRIFNKIKCEWKDIDKITALPNLLVIQQLRISDCCRYSEWHLDLFPQLQASLPRLNHLLINSNDSSNWLKYRHFDTISKLTLYQDEMKSIQPRIFSLDHLVHFPNLTCLHLDNYHLDWSETSKSPLQLNKLILSNCSWGYPFKLSQFGSISSLQITYSNHSFILSERFLDYLHECNPQLFSITSLSIECKKSLSPSILTTLIKNYPNLKSLTLLNWKINSSNFISIYLAKVKWNKLENVKISLFGDYDDEIITYAKQNYPNIQFRFTFLNPPQFVCSMLV